MSAEKKILFAVLDWGLGHATRSAPVIRALLQRGCTVVLVSSGRAAVWLSGEFPDLRIIEIPGYCITYHGGVVPAMIRQMFPLFSAIRREHRAFEAVALAERPDLIISDNRYGCHASGIPSVYIGHQLNFTVPLVGWMVTFIHRFMIRSFTEVAVPDTPDRVLSGKLSEISDRRITFIGPQSRFISHSASRLPLRWFITAVVSGPEPDASRFFNRLMPLLKSSGQPCLLVTADPKIKSAVKDNVVISAQMPSDELREALLSSRLVVSRSGYSSLMDYAALGVKALIVPTPGQPEQEYLARYAQAKRCAIYQRESAINLQKAVEEQEVLSGFPNPDGDGLLQSAIDRWLHIAASWSSLR